MATALPKNVLSVLHTESVAGHTNHMASAKANNAHASNLLRLVAVKKYDEPGAEESRAVRKVLALPKGE